MRYKLVPYPLKKSIRHWISDNNKWAFGPLVCWEADPKTSKAMQAHKIMLRN